MSETTILFADNNPDFLNTRAEFLEQAGYRVLKAYTLEEARRRLADDHVHLALLDVRMVDDDDEKDTSGLTLAKDPAYQLVPKIIITDFPSYKDVREALGARLDGLPPAVDFLAKKDGQAAMIQAVKQALAAHVQINWELEIHWDVQERLGFLYLVNLLQPEQPNVTLVQRADELEELFRRLFHDYHQIRIPRMFWHGAGRFCLPALARSEQGVIDTRVVICGERGALAQEIERIQKLTPETLHGSRLDSSAETLHFGAAAHVFPEVKLDTVRPLRTLFQAGKERPLKAAFNHLLKEVLPAWHQRGQAVDNRDLMTLYRQRAGLEEGKVARQGVERRLDTAVQMARSPSAVGVQRGGESLVFRFPNEPPLVCPDPLTAVYGSLEQYGTANSCRVSPGRLTADNILVDGAQRTWLTDFAQAGQVPRWWDFVCLEATIRFDLSQAPDMLAWLEFEECLTQPTRLYDRLPAQDVVPGLKTSVVLIDQIRHQASSEAGPDLLPYRAGLLVWVVGALADYDPKRLYTQAEQMRSAHLLLAAALLAQRIAQLPAMFDEVRHPTGRLRLDPDGVQVWRGEQRIPDLGPRELALFRCLYKQAGQVVPRQLLLERVFGKEYVLSDPESSLNTLIRQLRVKVEPDPRQPRYILGVRGVGYRLRVEGKTNE